MALHIKFTLPAMAYSALGFIPYCYPLFTTLQTLCSPFCFANIPRAFWPLGLCIFVPFSQVLPLAGSSFRLYLQCHLLGEASALVS